MLQEVASYGYVLTFGTEDNMTRLTRATSTVDGSERVDAIRARSNTMRDRAYTIREKETIGGGRARVASAAPAYRGRASSFNPPVKSLDINEDSFDPNDENIRPKGWLEVRMSRVMIKEENERLEGVDEESIILSRKKKLVKEEEIMVDEVLRYGTVVGMKSKINILGLEPSSMNTNLNTTTRASLTGYQPVILEEEELVDTDVLDEFNETLMKRVLKKEQVERERGMTEDNIASKRKEKEVTERAAMEAEMKKTGRVQDTSEPIGRKRSATLQQETQNLEIHEDNFSLPDPTKRPPTWNDVRSKRVTLKEHIDRIEGLPETAIVHNRAFREVEVRKIILLNY